MTVRSSKSKVLVCVGAVFFILGVVFLYDNTSRRLDEVHSKLERCSRNEESLTSQLQVILDYKVKLEQQLHKEKSDHAKTKEDLRNKAEEEKQIRERDNMESINKFTALQQQYKLLQSQHEDVTQELDKLKQEHLNDVDEKTRLENRISSLSQEMKISKESRETEIALLKSKNNKLEEDLKKQESKADWIKEKLDLQRELRECLSSNLTAFPNPVKVHVLELTKKLTNSTTTSTTSHRKRSNGDLRFAYTFPAFPVLFPATEVTTRAQPTGLTRKRSTSTASSRVSGEPPPVVEGGQFQFYSKTSTPMVNPQAILSQDKNSNVNLHVMPQPAVIDQFAHIPAIKAYKDQMESNREQRPQVAKQANRDYNYQAEYDRDRHNEEGDDDDPVDYAGQRDNLKLGGDQRPVLIPPIHESVVINPK